VVEANDKRHARVKVVETVVESLERGLRRAGIEVEETPRSP
jgi:polyphosphate kinase 2 (PPK2 family)